MQELTDTSPIATSISSLPFALTDACVDSGFPELSGLSIVDLCIAKKASLSFEGSEGGVMRPVDANTTLDDLMAAKTLRIDVHENV